VFLQESHTDDVMDVSLQGKLEAIRDGAQPPHDLVWPEVVRAQLGGGS
jgi:hypothetical protein